MKTSIPKFNIQDYVSFDNKIFKIKNIYCLSTGNHYSFVYSIILVGNNNYPDKFKLIIENFLKTPTKKELSTWNSLYGLG